MSPKSGATPPDEFGAHMSTAGGLELAPERASEVSAFSLQIFTKQPSRWAEPKILDEAASGFRTARSDAGIGSAGAHDSYLINLASPDRRLLAMSRRSFGAELARSAALGLDWVVTHPGSATDGDRPSGLDRNGDEIAGALAAGPPAVRILLEITAGAGNVLGTTFEELARIRDRVPEPARDRVGVCFDTCHAYSAGYDLLTGYDDVWLRFNDVLGYDRLGLFHLNDSQHAFASRRDRHAGIGEGSLGREPFRRIVNDERFREIPKILETPKGDDPVAADRYNLELLRSFREN